MADKEKFCGGSGTSKDELIDSDVRDLSFEALDRDLAEISIDVKFLQEQLAVDRNGYSSPDLNDAERKISQFQKRAEMLGLELEKRKKEMTL